MRLPQCPSMYNFDHARARESVMFDFVHTGYLEALLLLTLQSTHTHSQVTRMN